MAPVHPGKTEFHPRAHLRTIRNVAQGLATRSKILRAIENGASTLAEIRRSAGVGPSVADHHIRLLHREGIVRPLRSKPRRWIGTRFGQTSLDENLPPSPPATERP
ncbi:MAG: winged helix-turn-helix domain-containing protein [Halobacteria archaeon]